MCVVLCTRAILYLTYLLSSHYSISFSLVVCFKVRVALIKHRDEFLSAEKVCNSRAEKRTEEETAARDLLRRATAAAKTMEQVGGVTASNFTKGLAVSIGVVVNGVRSRVRGHINSKGQTRATDRAGGVKRFDVRCFRSVTAKLGAAVHAGRGVCCRVSPI